MRSRSRSPLPCAEASVSVPDQTVKPTARPSSRHPDQGLQPKPHTFPTKPKPCGAPPSPLEESRGPRGQLSPRPPPVAPPAPPVAPRPPSGPPPPYLLPTDPTQRASSTAPASVTQPKEAYRRPNGGKHRVWCNAFYSRRARGLPTDDLFGPQWDEWRPPTWVVRRPLCAGGCTPVWALRGRLLSAFTRR